MDGGEERKKNALGIGSGLKLQVTGRGGIPNRWGFGNRFSKFHGIERCPASDMIG